MIHPDILKNLCQSLCNLKIDLFCISSCNSNEYGVINRLVFELLSDIYCKADCGRENCKNFIELVIKMLHHIEENTDCKKNYAYLLQIQRLSCLLNNFERFLCQIKCLPTKDCELISKILCTLYEIIDLLQGILCKINNIECLCCSHLCCSDDIIECLICSMSDDISNLENNISILAHLILELASLNVINCTTCCSTHCSRPSKKYCPTDQCESNHFKYNCFNNRTIK